ncbi:iron-sulfur cluster assembly accessory protein, putative [Eimeria mitis]|uniref:Iron-sulfur cluster assembly accessory protein, putative n=1 Tax=Eimeria mitis TaxID=44415 RepID=U6KF94_9EIME|nr:iron-sulfur cluster assembly accessory protein, putative [Eimeria mitis]CDJ36624.1 iron-sulfur cluster assembly accessory protein, putative [Eimeria mitis]
MLPAVGFVRLAAKEFIRCGAPRPLQGSAARGCGSACAKRVCYSPSKSTAPAAATAAASAAAAVETAAADINELNWGIFQQHLCSSAEEICCCIPSKGITGGRWVYTCTAPHQYTLRGQRYPRLGDIQIRLFQGFSAAAHTPLARAVPSRNSSSSSSSISSSRCSSRSSSTSTEFGEVYGPRSREAVAAALAGFSRGLPGDRAAPAAAAAGAAAGGRPPLLSATPAAVGHIKKLVKDYNDALQQQQQQQQKQQQQQQRDGEPPLKATGIRISLQRQGCSGMAYDVTLCTERRPERNEASAAAGGAAAGAAAADAAAGGSSQASGAAKVPSRRGRNWGEDEVVRIDGVEIRVAADAVMLLIGTQIDFVDEDVQTGFVFNNPNQKQSCGCGKSFMV